MDRIRSGSDQLDRILGGGFPAHAIHIIMGDPGAGKTILAEKLALTNATTARPVVYVATVSEPVAKLVAFLQEYSFGDTSRIGTDVVYAGLGDELSAHPERLVELITGLVQTHRPGVLVIDSFKAIADLMPDRAAWRRALYGVAGLLSAYRTTSFWVGEYTPEMSAQLPEFAVADGIVALSREQHGSRDFRFLRVVKLRGSGFLDGKHAFRITRDGLDVYPRLTSPVVSPEYRPIDERLSTGIAGLDRMIATGWLRGSTTIVVGPSGAGKTLMGLQFLRQGVEAGEPGLLLTLEESPVQLARVMDHLGWDPASLVSPGKLDVFFCSPVELQIDTIVRELFGRIEKNGVRRIVIDGLGDLSTTADDPVRLRDYLFALTQTFAVRNVTGMMTIESSNPATFGFTREGLSYLGDNLLLLEMSLGEELTRTVRVLKTRGSAHDPRCHRLTIGTGGVLVE